MIDPSADRPKYRQIADELCRRIAEGEYPPGGRLPSEVGLVQEFGVARNTARQAIGELVHDGLVVVTHGKGTRVRDTRVMEEVVVPHGFAVEARMSTKGERAHWGIDVGVPVLQLVERDTGYPGQAYPADRYRLVGEGDAGQVSEV